jgi:protein-tyrosine phosphatase
MKMKILMVCLGNICRSPLAEGILRHKAEQKALKLTVDSAGTADYHVGEAPDRRTQSNALQHGIDLSALRGRQFQPTDFETFDRIYVMDKSNYADVIALAKNQFQRDKVELLLEALMPGDKAEVPDPYFGGSDGFEHVFQLLNQACENITKELKDA